MVASGRLLHLAAAAATTAVATCFACPGGISRGVAASSAAPSPTASADSMMTPRTATATTAVGGARATGTVSSRGSPGRSSTSRCATAPAQEESALRTRGGGGDAGSGEADPGLAETDPEVWEIINAERRRQVGCVRQRPVRGGG